MDFEFFTALVGVIGVAYAGFSQFIRSKLVDKKQVEEMQKESKRLSQEFDKAKKSGNQKEMEIAMQKQMQFLPKMNKVMFAQMKPMFVMILILFGVMWAFGIVDPTTKDDITVPMLDDGNGCDRVGGDNIYSACYDIRNENYGKWVYTATAFKDGGQVGMNQTYFLFNSDDESDTFSEKATGESIVSTTGKMIYYPGEAVVLYADYRGEKGIDKIEATLNNGTAFRVDLPVAIPIFNVQKIYHPYWWFILISFITSISISIIMKGVKKK